jgi:Protein of unknown function (DUF2442)
MTHDAPRLTAADLAAARRRGATADRTEPRATAARYDAASGRIVVDLTNGCSFAFPARALQGLAEASDADLAAVEVIGAGLGLHWEAQDADFTVPGLLMGLFGGAAWLAREQARRAGAATSPAKAQAARENGRKGGRPRGSVRAGSA